MNTKMKSFNFSPSSLGVYMNSQINFFYSYLSYEEPTNDVVQAYGRGGSVVHDALEHYHLNGRDKNKTTEFFVEQWKKQNLNTLIGLNGRILPKQTYYSAFLYGCELIDTKYEVIDSELELIFPFRPNCNKKGYVDVIAMYEGEKCIMDYKTSSSMDTDTNGTFRNQTLFYAHLYWCKTGELIKRARIEYLKLQEAKDFRFTEEEIKNYEENVLIPIWNNIQKNGMNPRNYEIGDWDTPFCAYKQLCKREQLVRQNKGAIQVMRENNRLVFLNGFEGGIKDFVDHYFSYDVAGKEFVDSYKTKKWDGKKHFLKSKSLPFSYIWKLQELIDAYNKKLGTTHWLNLTDNRNKEIVNTKYQTKFKDTDIVLRGYQNEAINEAMQRKFGILYLGTSAGKTLLSAELIKKLNRRTLFLVNRIELVRQTKEEFENYLGVEVGEMAQGKMDITKQITVASIQTISAILKRKNADSKKLKMYLYNVTCCLADESQNVKDSGQYAQISDELVNVEYMLGLSGSPFRNDETTLEMNAMVGFIIYRKSTASLEKEGWITPTKTYFLGCPQNDDQFETPQYHENYQSFITKNTLRNQTITKVVGAWRDKKKIMILVKSIEHGEIIEELIKGSFFLNGSTQKKKRKDMFDKFKNEDGLVLISMVSIMGAGVSIDDLDIIINASAFGSDISSVQTIGRVKRKKEGKKYGMFVDFNDTGIFNPMAFKRMNMLEQFGNPVDKSLHISEWEKMNFD